MKVFWLSRMNDLVKNVVTYSTYDHYAVLPKDHNLPYQDKFKEIITMGEDIKTDYFSVTYEQFLVDNKSEANITTQMKYVYLQALSYCLQHKIDYLYVNMMFFENEFFMSVNDQLKNMINVNFFRHGLKIVNVINCNFIPTGDSIKFILSNSNLIYSYDTSVCETVHGYGVNPNVKKIRGSLDQKFKSFNKRDTAIKLLKALKESDRLSYNSTFDISEDDMIIYVSNNLKESVEIFKRIEDHSENLKLWINNFNKSLDIESIKDKVITTEKLKQSQLNLVYNICQFGLNISTGDDWVF